MSSRAYRLSPRVGSGSCCRIGGDGLTQLRSEADGQEGFAGCLLQRMLWEDVIVMGSGPAEKMTWLDAYVRTRTKTSGNEGAHLELCAFLASTGANRHTTGAAPGHISAALCLNAIA